MWKSLPSYRHKIEPGSVSTPVYPNPGEGPVIWSAWTKRTKTNSPMFNGIIVRLIFQPVRPPQTAYASLNKLMLSNRKPSVVSMTWQEDHVTVTMIANDTSPLSDRRMELGEIFLGRMGCILYNIHLSTYITFCEHYQTKGRTIHPILNEPVNYNVIPGAIPSLLLQLSNNDPWQAARETEIYNWFSNTMYQCRANIIEDLHYLFFKVDYASE